MSRLVLVLAFLLSASNAFAQRLTVNFGAVPQPVYFATVPHIICDSGCGSPPASADKSTFIQGTTNVSPVAFIAEDTTIDGLTVGTYGAAAMTQNRILYIDYSKSAGAIAAQLVPNTDIPFITQLMGGTDGTTIGNNGTSIYVQCTSGCSGGEPGQQFMSASQPVAIALDQSAIPITAATLPLPALAATSTIQTTQQTALDAIKVDVDKIPSQGQAVAASSLPVVLTAIQQAALTPPAAITGFALDTSLTTINTTLVAIQAVLQTPTPKLLWPCNALRRVNCR